MGFDKCFVIFYTYRCYDSLWQDFLNSKQQALKIENTDSKAESESYKSRVAKRERKAAKTLGAQGDILVSPPLRGPLPESGLTCRQRGKLHEGLLPLPLLQG